MYNFYIFLLASTLFRPISKFLLKNMFNTLTVMEEILCSTFILFVTFLIIFKYFEKGRFDKLLNKFLKNTDNIIPKLLLYDFVIIILILSGSYIILNEKIIYGESMKISLYIITMSLITIVFNGGINLPFGFGLLLIILGIYFVEMGNKKLKY